MVADLIISRTAPRGTHDAILPTGVSSIINSPSREHRIPAELHSKILFFGDYGFLCWSGSYIFSRRARKFINECIQNGGLHPDLVFKKLSKMAGTESGFIFGFTITLHDRKSTKFYSHNVWPEFLEGWTYSAVSGTGQEYYPQILNEVVDALECRTQVEPLDHVGAHLIALSKLLDLEFNEDVPSSALFGGFYEVAVWMPNSGFIRLHDICFSSFEVHLDKDSRITSIVPLWAASGRYFENEMVIRFLSKKKESTIGGFLRAVIDKGSASKVRGEPKFTIDSFMNLTQISFFQSGIFIETLHTFTSGRDLLNQPFVETGSVDSDIVELRVSEVFFKEAFASAVK